MPAFPDPETRNALADECRRCPDLVEAREHISWGNGPLDSDLVVVGEAPGTGNPAADRWRGGNWTGMAYTNPGSSSAGELDVGAVSQLASNGRKDQQTEDQWQQTNRSLECQQETQHNRWQADNITDSFAERYLHIR